MVQRTKPNFVVIDEDDVDDFPTLAKALKWASDDVRERGCTQNVYRLVAVVREPPKDNPVVEFVKE